MRCVLDGRRSRPRGGDPPRRGAPRHGHGRPDARRPRRADHVRRQARRLGVRARARSRPGSRARWRGCGSASSRAPSGRTAAATPRSSGWPASGWASRRSRSRPRSCRATGTRTCSPRSRSAPRRSTASRPRSATSREPRCARCRSRFGSGQKGSSAMPHKRNPVVAERLSGLARVVRAAAPVGLENVALWHERDISHSSAERVVLPDAFLALDYMLDRFAWLVDGLVVDAGADAAESRRVARPGLQPARPARARRVGALAGRGVPARPAKRPARLGRGARLPGARRGGSGDRRPPGPGVAGRGVRPRRRVSRHVDVLFERLGGLAERLENERRRPFMPEGRPRREREGPRDLRARRRAPAARRQRPDLDVRRRAPDRDPRQGSRAHRPLGLLVRAHARASSPTTCSHSDRTGGRPRRAGSRCCRSSASSAATWPAPAGRTTRTTGACAATGSRPGCASRSGSRQPIFTPATKAQDGPRREHRPRPGGRARRLRAPRRGRARLDRALRARARRTPRSGAS